jgi:CheY-like chemotaxis protein
VIALEDVGWRTRDLTIEVTETMLMREPAAAADALARLRALGMRVEVDDFGTGFSSLGRLVDLPIDGLKIDRRFVGSMTRDHRSESIVRAIVALAHDLGLEVVAEGVEDRETWELLGALGCDTVQGFYVAVPMAAASLPGWLASWEASLGALHPARAPSPRGHGSATEVLVVDDEPVIVEVIRGILEQQGFRVVTAANGAEALRELERQMPALVLLDMQMPILDGQGFVRAVRERRIEVPIVVMTAGSSAARWAKELPVNAYLSKPFGIDRLVEVTSRFAGRQ